MLNIDAISWCWYLVEWVIYLCWQNKKNLNRVLDIVRDQTSSTYLHLLCYFVYQNTSNNALPLQSWSSKFNLCPHMKTRWNCVCQFYFIIYCLKAKSYKGTYFHSKLSRLVWSNGWKYCVHKKSCYAFLQRKKLLFFLLHSSTSVLNVARIKVLNI